MCIVTCSSVLIVILCRGPHSAVTQLRVNPLCESSFLEVHLARGVTFWALTHALQSLVTRPGGVSTFLSYHTRGSPLVIAFSWVVFIPGSPSSGVGTSRVRIPPIGARTYGLEATFFFSLFTCSGLSRPEASLRCLSLVLCLGALTWRRRYLTMP